MMAINLVIIRVQLSFSYLSFFNAYTSTYERKNRTVLGV